MSNPLSFVALGERRYRVIKPFAKFPAGVKAGKMTGGAVDSKGNLHICQRTDPPVVVFDRNGEFVRSYGSGVIADSHGLSITPDDRVLVVDRDRHQVVAFDLEGRVVFTLGERDKPREGAPFSHPTDAAVGPN